MRVGVDSRRHPDEDVFDTGGRRPLDLVERVQDDETCAGLRRSCELLVALVVPVDHDALALDPGAQRDLELAHRRHVRPDALPCEQAQDRSVGERLDAVDDERVGCGLQVCADGAEHGALVVDDERRSELGCELRGAPPADDELSTFDRRAIGKDLEHAHDSACGT